MSSNRLLTGSHNYTDKNITTSVVDHIAASLETKKYCSGLFLDVAQAFDTVWHDGLLFKLKKIFPAPYYLLLKSYLNNRTFRVKLKTTLSSTHNILAGVPQGSDITPFLYTLFTANIPSTDNTLIGTYADDTAILSSSQDPHEASGLLQNHLNSLSHWFNSWKIKINDSKSSHITFSLRPGNCPHIIYENAIIPHTNEVKYLGLLFDRRLTWGPHLKTKLKQLNSRLHILGIALWGTTKPSNTRTIQAFQAICLRTIAKAPWYVTNLALHNDLQIPTTKQTAIKY
ncbi:Reverse transcriptase domain [Cinara cedri]|uniref:Reverse transcriptase domain n=1 Tax=Cinara cedri TaxID=506608 RepID=A0A5E4N9M8_9HEMI|nr:Reverse transcriptase domain [Cinara cedri]